MIFNNYITNWYLGNKRNLPWRETNNPYVIWLSEIILQQTKISQGLPYFYDFINTFPTVFDLANATEEEILRHWQGLGYYSRARNLHATAKYITSELNGIFPKDYKNLLKLKGVGEYTAAAIASFSYNEIVPVVDGNVFRVLSRYFNIESDISNSKTKKEFFALAQNLISKENPALFNQAIMEFGALQCVPKNPNCTICPLNSSCEALAKNKVQELPFKLKKIKIKERFFNYLFVLDNLNKIEITQRTSKGIWFNLYELPLIETECLKTEKEIFSIIKNKYDDIFEIVLFDSESIIHKLTHQHINIKFWKVKRNGNYENYLKYNDLEKFPFPIVLYNFLKNNNV